MRLDLFLVQSGQFSSREKAQEAIKAGSVLVDGKSSKPSAEVGESSDIKIVKKSEYVSRGAYKLLRASEVFDFSFQNKIVVDIGASTGGFTQVALQGGASKVYSVDVGQGELDQSLRSDPRVVNLENHDFRALTKPDLAGANLVVSDVSFISLRHILPKIKEILGKIECILLFKPQFECGKEVARKFKGVVLDEKLHKNLLKDFVLYVKGLGFEVSGFTFSTIRGKEGNIEYLFHINGCSASHFDIEQVVTDAFKMKRLKTQK